MLSHRSSWKCYNSLIVVVCKGIVKVEEFDFKTREIREWRVKGMGVVDHCVKIKDSDT